MIGQSFQLYLVSAGHGLHNLADVSLPKSLPLALLPCAEPSNNSPSSLKMWPIFLSFLWARQRDNSVQDFICHLSLWNFKHTKHFESPLFFCSTNPYLTPQSNVLQTIKLTKYINELLFLNYSTEQFFVIGRIDYVIGIR